MYDVLDARSLARVAQVSVPVSIVIHTSERDRVWAVRKDSMDVPELIRLRIRRQ
jgi:hypothetical protein